MNKIQTNGYYSDFFYSSAYYEYEYFVLIEDTFYKFKSAVNHALQEELETMNVAKPVDTTVPKQRVSVIGPLKRVMNPTSLPRNILTN